MEKCGIALGWNCLEIGAGDGSVARWMAARVGPAGCVLATDIDPRFVLEDGSANPANMDAFTPTMFSARGRKPETARDSQTEWHL